MAIDIIAMAGNFLLFLLVFNMSATVDIACMKAQLQNHKAILTGISCQFILLPFLGFIMVRLLRLDYAMGIMLLVVTSSPGGSYSNWWCSMFNADLALSVSMTAISTILSTVMLPLNLLLYTKFSYQGDILANLDWTSLFIALAIVITAISAGLFCSWKVKSRRFNKIANQCGNIAGFCLIVFSATMTNSGEDADTKIWSRHWTFYVAVIFPCLGGLVLATMLSTFCNLLPPERITVAIEACYQNVGIATSVALTMFDGKELNVAMGVPFFYGVVEAALVGCFCVVAWKAGWTKAPSDAPFWMVIFTSYEVIEAELKDLDGIEIAISQSEDISVESQEGSVFTTYFNLSYVAKEILDPKPDATFTKKTIDGSII